MSVRHLNCADVCIEQMAKAVCCPLTLNLLYLYMPCSQETLFVCAAGRGLPPNVEGEEVCSPASEDGAGGRLLHHPCHLCHGGH